jgi:hypothetical protein
LLSAVQVVPSQYEPGKLLQSLHNPSTQVLLAQLLSSEQAKLLQIWPFKVLQEVQTSLIQDPDTQSVSVEQVYESQN